MSKTYDLQDISTRAPKKLKKKVIQAETKTIISELQELQNLLYAESKWAILVVFQGMDASGKDGATRKVFGPLNPQGVRVNSFKKPTPEEFAHDYLWRVHKQTPAKGMINIFNRSHYEDVLITRVEGWIDEETTYKRFNHINNFEQLLVDCNTKVLKFYLHISQKEQRESFYDRITDPRKQWKYSEDDFNKAKKWAAYHEAYEDVLNNCSEAAPWIVVPADQNWYKEYFIAKTVKETLESLNMTYPKGKINFDLPDVQAVLEEFSD